MTRQAQFTRWFGDAEYLFKATIACLETIQEQCGAGPLVVWNKLHHGDWKVADVQTPILFGLIAGGMEAERATTLVNRWCGPGYLEENVPLARDVIGIGINSQVDETLPKSETPGEEAGDPSQTDGSPSVSSSDKPA